MTAEHRLSEEEMRRRLPLWVALTSLFLDTEVTEHDLHHVARTARRAGYSAAEVEELLFQDVAPVFMWNLLAVAGEWQPWPDSFVEARMRERTGRERTRTWLGRRLARWLLRDDVKRLHSCLLEGVLKEAG